jgi:hypothetical protein
MKYELYKVAVCISRSYIVSVRICYRGAVIQYDFNKQLQPK